MVKSLLLSLMVTASGLVESSKPYIHKASEYSKQAYDYSKPYVVTYGKKAYEFSKAYSKWIIGAVAVPCAYKLYRSLTKKKAVKREPVSLSLAEVTTEQVAPEKVTPEQVVSGYQKEITDLLTRLDTGDMTIVVSDDLLSQMPYGCQKRIIHAMRFYNHVNERLRVVGVNKLRHTLRLCLS